MRGKVSSNNDLDVDEEYRLVLVDNNRGVLNLDEWLNSCSKEVSLLRFWKFSTWFFVLAIELSIRIRKSATLSCWLIVVSHKLFDLTAVWWFVNVTFSCLILSKLCEFLQILLDLFVLIWEFSPFLHIDFALLSEVVLVSIFCEFVSIGISIDKRDRKWLLSSEYSLLNFFIFSIWKAQYCN